MNALRSILVAILSTAALHAQPSLRSTLPADGARFHKSDTIRVAWEGRGDDLVRVEAVDESGRARLVRDRVDGDATTVDPMTVPGHLSSLLPPGRHRIRLTRIRPDSSTSVIRVIGPGELYGSPALSADGEELAMMLSNGVVRVWDLATGYTRRDLTIPAITADWPDGLPRTPRLEYSDDGRRLALLSAGGGASYVVDARSGDVIWSDTGAVDDMSADGTLLAAGNVVRRIDGGAFVMALGDSSYVPAGLELSHDNGIAISRTEISVVVWSLVDGRRLRRWTIDPMYTLYDVRLSPDGRRVAATADPGGIHLFDIETGDYFVASCPMSYSLSFAPDGHTVAVALLDGVVGMFDTRRGRRIANHPTGGWNFGNVRFTSDGRRLVSADYSRSIRIRTIEERIDTVVSGAVFEVLPARVTLDFLGDLGWQIVPTTRGPIRAGTLSTLETVAVRIESIGIAGRDSAVFLLRMKRVPIGLTDPLRIEVEFRPAQAVVYEAELVVALEDDTLRVPLRGAGVYQSVVPGMSTIEFGSVPVNIPIDTVVTAIVRNVDSIPHTVTFTIDTANGHIQYRLLEGAEVVLAPGATHYIRIRYESVRSSHVGEYGYLHVGFDGYGSPFTILLHGMPFGVGAVGVEGSGAIEPARIVAQTRTTATLRLPRGADEIVVVNTIGESRRLAADVEAGDVVIDHGPLPAGLHFIVVRSGPNHQAIALPVQGGR